MQDKDSSRTINTGATQGTAAALVEKIRRWGQELGFSAIGIAAADVAEATPNLMRWLALGRHGEMDYMAKHAALRSQPDSLIRTSPPPIVASHKAPSDSWAMALI